MATTTTDDSDPVGEQVKEHLNQALEADRPRTRNYHVRTALQLLDASRSTDEHGSEAE